MADNPYPPGSGDDYRMRDLERRLDRVEQRVDSISELGVIKSDLTYIRRDIERVDKKLDAHIDSVKPLITSDASRSGVSGLLRWVVPIVVAGAFALLNVLIATGAIG